MKPFSLLIKPAGADCNLRCAYCFYLGRASLYPQTRRHRMDAETLEALVQSYMATPQPQHAFAWQGGEPTLMGLEFFERVVQLQKKYGAAGSSVANHVQTNGLGITPAMARHFRRYNFLLGVSLDGPAAVHDVYRRGANGRGSHGQVLAGTRVLRENQVKLNILTLVSKASVSRGREIYRYLCGEGFDFHQYIPCVEFDRTGRPQPYSITGQEWGGFLCQVFDEWIRRDAGRVSVRYFDSLLHKMVVGTHNLCHLGRECCQYLVVEHNGDVYPCDFFVEDRLKLGNLRRDSWEELLASSSYRSFGAQKRDWDPECAACPFLEYCGADCLKHRLSHGSGLPSQKSWLCQGYRQFLAHALPTLQALAQELRGGRGWAADGPGPNEAAGVGRNEPCPCGSGRKYKKCCGRQVLGPSGPRGSDRPQAN